MSGTSYYTLLDKIIDFKLESKIESMPESFTTLYQKVKPRMQEDRWGIGRDTQESYHSMGGMAFLSSVNCNYQNEECQAIGKQVTWIFLVCRLGTFSNDQKLLTFLKGEITDALKVLLNQLKNFIEPLSNASSSNLSPEEITADASRKKSLVLYVLSIELINLHIRQINCGDNSPIVGTPYSSYKEYYTNIPIEGCALIDWVTSETQKEKEVFNTFISLVTELGAEYRTWEMLLHALMGRAKREKLDYIESTLKVKEQVDALYPLMRETSLTNEACRWLFVPEIQRKNFTHYLDYTKKDIYNKISELPLEESQAFLKHVFHGENSKSDSLVKFMLDRGVVKRKYQALKYLYLLAGDYLMIKSPEPEDRTAIFIQGDKLQQCFLEIINSKVENTLSQEQNELAQKLENKQWIVAYINKIVNLKERIFYLAKALDEKSVLSQFLMHSRSSTPNLINTPQIKQVEAEYNRVKKLLAIVLALEEPSISNEMRTLLINRHAGEEKGNKKDMEAHILAMSSEERFAILAEKNTKESLLYRFFAASEGITGILSFWSKKEQKPPDNRPYTLQGVIIEEGETDNDNDSDKDFNNEEGIALVSRAI